MLVCKCRLDTAEEVKQHAPVAVMVAFPKSRKKRVLHGRFESRTLCADRDIIWL